MSFLLRVVLPDKPGSLGALATALGNAGADILSVDVVERSRGHAVDDLAVELPSGRPPDVLITAAESIPGVEVESVRPHSGKLDTHRELELVEEITSDPARGLQLLADGVPRIFRAGWALARPLRAYLGRGRPNRIRTLVEGMLVHTVLRLAPPTFIVGLSAGGSIELRYDERIGLSTLIKGSFEAAETDELCRHALAGTTAVDAGANVGLLTIPLAQAVGESGRVLAFEPSGSTAGRLRENIRRNELANVTVVEAALGRTAGEGRLELAPDAAYNTLTALGTEGTVPVRIATLDAVWEEEGRPELSVLKIDVEGSELDVLRGATTVLRSCRPTVMVELAEPAARRAVEELLRAEGYRAVERNGFQPWNRLFLPEPGRSGEPGPLIH